LNELTQITWLSIHRGSLKGRDENESYESTVDKKLTEISQEFSKYLSSLHNEASEQTRKFEETFWISLVRRESVNSIFKNAEGLNLKAEQKALESLFKEVNIYEGNTTEKIEVHFKTAQKTQEKLARYRKDNRVHIILDDFFNMAVTSRMHFLVQQWEALQSRHQEIYLPREKFLTTINSMFLQKELRFNLRNELTIYNSEGDEFPPRGLSSGEKQLFILLASAVLQQGQPFIYVADEPELFLHVDWQVMLIDAVRSLNPSAQILVATHSPDIVSHFNDKIFDMEGI